MEAFRVGTKVSVQSKRYIFIFMKYVCLYDNNVCYIFKCEFP